MKTIIRLCKTNKVLEIIVVRKCSMYNYTSEIGKATCLLSTDIISSFFGFSAAKRKSYCSCSDFFFGFSARFSEAEKLLLLLRFFFFFSYRKNPIGFVHGFSTDHFCHWTNFNFNEILHRDSSHSDLVHRTFEIFVTSSWVTWQRVKGPIFKGP